MLGLAMVAIFFMLLPPCRCFCFSCRARHVPTCRPPPGEGGPAKRKGRGISHPEQKRRTSEAKVCTSAARKTAGNPLCCARAEPSARFGFLIRARVRAQDFQRQVAAGTGRRDSLSLV